MRGLPSLQIVNGKWRGIMPFRVASVHPAAPPIRRNHLDTQRRTGEPSPSPWNPRGYGMARGSYTEGMRQSLWSWMSEKYGSSLSSLTFEYKLHRKRNITVTGSCPYIKHMPDWGNGKRGFILEVDVESIDGLPYQGLGRRTRFSWNRIIGRERFLALPRGVTQVVV